MHRPFFVWPLIVLLTSASWAEARIGETREELAQHYGAGKEIGGQMLYTVEKDYSMSAYFQGEKVSMEVYSRMPNVDGSHDELKDADIQKLLAIEGSDKLTWNKLITKSGEQSWYRSDGKVIARLRDVKPSDNVPSAKKVLVFMDANLK